MKIKFKKQYSLEEEVIREFEQALLEEGFMDGIKKIGQKVKDTISPPDLPAIAEELKGHLLKLTKDVAKNLDNQRRSKKINIPQELHLMALGEFKENNEKVEKIYKHRKTKSPLDTFATNKDVEDERRKHIRSGGEPSKFLSPFPFTIEEVADDFAASCALSGFIYGITHLNPEVYEDAMRIAATTGVDVADEVVTDVLPTDYESKEDLAREKKSLGVAKICRDLRNKLLRNEKDAKPLMEKIYSDLTAKEYSGFENDGHGIYLYDRSGAGLTDYMRSQGAQELTSSLADAIKKFYNET